ncbi:MAG: LysM peptidoglycan-binding domain-containing protein, partial [SAR324 cluster bacterium]|nr:LysM peptidoglycan-binding domain-containing protein [SAR324 cluster bacterium]
TPTNLAAKKGEKTYRIKKGDTLWGIAKDHYGSGTLWRTIAEANPDKIKYLPNEVVHIYPGDELVIPEVDLSEEKNKPLPERAPTKADKQANQPAIEKEKEQFQWDWNEHVWILMAKGESLQGVVDYFNDLMKLEKEKKITVKQVTEHVVEGKTRVYFPLKTGDVQSEKDVQRLIVGTLRRYRLDMTRKFFERGMKKDASIWKIEPKSEVGQWILNSVTFQKVKIGIKKQIAGGGDLTGNFSYSPSLNALKEEWKTILDIQLFGALGTMHWKAIPKKDTGVYELVLWDDFDFEAAGHRSYIGEKLTSAARKGDFTPFRTELRMELDINK